MTREEETTNIEHVLQHHRQLHDEMTSDLGKMAQQLKMNTQLFGDILNKDDQVNKIIRKTIYMPILFYATAYTIYTFIHSFIYIDT